MKCKYCKKTIWPWQSWDYTLLDQWEQIPEYAELVIPDYDLYAHESCFFRGHNNKETQQEKTN